MRANFSLWESYYRSALLELAMRRSIPAAIVICENPITAKRGYVAIYTDF